MLGTVTDPPENSIGFFTQVAKAMIASIPQIIRNSITQIVVSFVVANLIHFYLIGWVNDGWSPGNNPVINALIFVDGQETSPRVMLFYFLLGYIFWWLIGSIRSKGAIGALRQVASTPIWVAKSLVDTGVESFAYLMAGISLSFLLGLTLLTGPSSIMMLLMSFTWLVAQENSLLVIGVQYLSRDISRAITKKPIGFSPPSRPVVGILGTSIGYAYMVFYKPNTTSMLVFILLTCAGTIYAYRRNKTGTAPIMSLLFLTVAYSLYTSICFGDDGGIRENGGWSSVVQEPWLRDELIERGLPASTSASLGAFTLYIAKPKPERKFGWHVAYFDTKPTTREPTTHMKVTDGVELVPQENRPDTSTNTRKDSGDTASISAAVGAANAAVDAADAAAAATIGAEDIAKGDAREGSVVHDDGHITGSVEDIITRWPSGDEPTVSFEMGKDNPLFRTTVTVNEKGEITEYQWTDEINLEILNTEDGTGKATDLFKFEYLSPDSDDIFETDSIDDTLWQFRYKVWF